MADSLGFFKSNKIHISLTYLGGFLSFLPLIVGVDSNLEATSFGSSIRSQLFRDSCVASLALIAPFMFDSVVDMTGLLLGATAEHEPLLKAKSKTGRSEESFFTYTERIPFVLGIMILPVAVLTVTAMDCTNAGLIVSCSRKAQLMLIAGSIATSLCRHEFIVPKSVSLVSIVLFCIGQTVGSFASNRSRLDPLDRSARALYFVNVIFSYCGAFVVLLFCARWLIKFMVVETKNKPLGKAFLQTIKLSDLLSNISAVPESDAHAIKFLNFRAMFVSIIVFWGILSAVVTSKYGDIVNLDATGLFLGVLPYLLLQAAVLGLTIRLAKHEVVQGLVSYR